VPSARARRWEQGQPLTPELNMLFTTGAYIIVALCTAEQMRRDPDADRAKRLETLDASCAWMQARAADQPSNFQHLLHLMHAERAWAAGAAWEAALAFDAARKDVHHRQRPWHKALIAERAALFHLAHGMDHAGQRLMAEARDLYAAWGAAAKVRLMDQSWPFLQPASQSLARGLPGRLLSGPSPDMLDLLGILRASQALSSQRTLRDLALRVTEVLGALTGATRVALIAAAGNDWLLLDSRPDAELHMMAFDEAAKAGLLPASAQRHIERLVEPLQVPDIAEDERFSGDPYFAERGGSLLLVPVVGQGEARAVLFLENTALRAAFGDQRLDAVMLIAGQLAVSLANAQLYDGLETRVRERAAQIEQLQGELVATAHRAGMAQIASNVLHNVGNVLTSVTVAAFALRTRVQGSRAPGVSRAAQVMKEQGAGLPQFMADDSRGRMLPQYLADLGEALRKEQDETLHDIEGLLRNVDHISAIVGSQQALAGSSWLKESVTVKQLLDDALRISEGTLVHGTQVVRGDEPTLQLEIDRTRVLQVLVNLIVNADEAMLDSPQRTLALGARLKDDGPDKRLRITVSDSGHGITSENLPRLFSHGFSTKKDGNGFGLHSAAIAAMEMGGKLTAHSDGPGRGATFTLEIPIGDAKPGATAQAPS
jgi:signal transduction histidine kinase